MWTNLLCEAPDSALRHANYGEAGLWWLVAVVLLLASSRQTGGTRQRCLWAALAFAVFGFTDIIEAGTGAWWEPWWLLVLKGACLAAMVVLLVLDWRARRAAADGDGTTESQGTSEDGGERGDDHGSVA